MRRWGLIADDLTGACDAGVQFAERGVSTLVHLGPCAQEAELLIIPTGSRDDPPEEARRKVREACALVTQDGRTLVYKKIDSTLRGNIGPEIDAALEAAGLCHALIAPAYPAMGRTIRGGRLFIDGRDSGLEMAGTLDAATEADLAAIAVRALAERPPALLVGSAGLAKELAKLLVPAAQPANLECRAREGPVVVIAGSPHPATARQIGCLRRHGIGCRIVEIHWTPGELDSVLEGPVGAIVATGGDTAALVARVLGAAGIALERQILEGIPCGTLVGGQRPGLPLVTKAGGFGGEDALAVVAEALGAGRNP